MKRAILAAVLLAGCGGSEADPCAVNGACSVSGSTYTCWARGTGTYGEGYSLLVGTASCPMIAGTLGTIQHPGCTTPEQVQTAAFECP